MAEPTPESTPETVEASAPPRSRGFFQVLWERKWLVLLGLAVGLTLGAVYFSQAKVIYRSEAQIHVVRKDTGSVPIGGAEVRLPSSDDFVGSHLVVLTSPEIAQRAAKKIKDQVAEGKLQPLATLEGQSNPAEIIQRSLKATRDSRDTSSGSSTIINLTCQGPVAEDCGVILAAVIKSYRDYLNNTYDKVNDNTLDLIRKAHDALDNKYKSKLVEQKTFLDAHRELAFKGRDGVNVPKALVLQIEGRRSTLLVQEAELQGRLKAVEDAKAEGGRKALQIALTASRQIEKDKAANPARAVEEQLLPLLVQEQDLLANFGEEHPEVKAIRRKIAVTRELLGKLPKPEVAPKATKEAETVEDYVQSLQQELTDIQGRRNALDQLLAKTKKEAEDLDGYERTEASMVSEIGQTRAVLDQIVASLQKLNLTQNFGGYEVKDIAPPGDGRKVAPNPWQVFLVAGILGLLVGLGLAYLADLTDKSFRTPEEIRRRLGLSVIGHIPFMARTDKAEKSEATWPNGNGVALDPSLRVYHRPRSREAEAYRSLRTSLYFSTRMGRHTVLQITSPNTGDGKSTLAANLAISIAQSGKKVVVVDADFRRPRQHALFGLSPAHGGAGGLASVIVGEAELPDAVHSSAVEGLSVLPCGPRPLNPAELLTSPRFEELLGQLRERYDFVIIDTPPLLAVTDPCVVAPRVDGVLLIIRVSRNGRPAAERAKDMLATLGAKVLGVVVNATARDAGAGGYGYGYGYGYDTNYEYESREPEADNAKPAAKG